jgi:integrase
LTGEVLHAGGGVASVGVGDDSHELLALRDEWLLEYGSENTRLAYRRDIGHWLRFLAASGVDPLHGVLRKHAMGWLRAQELEHAAKASRARRLAAVSAFYDWLTTMEHFSRANPAAVGRKRTPRPDRRSAATFALSRDEAGRCCRRPTLIVKCRRLGRPRSCGCCCSPALGSAN